MAGSSSPVETKFGVLVLCFPPFLLLDRDRAHRSRSQATGALSLTPSLVPYATPAAMSVHHSDDRGVRFGRLVSSLPSIFTGTFQLGQGTQERI